MKKTSKLLFGFVLVTLILGLVACGSGGDSAAGGTATEDSAGGESGTVYEWKIGSIYSDPATVQEFNSFGLAQQKFVDLVEEKTNGQVKITPFYNSVLGGDQELFQQVRLGELEVFFGNALSGVDARFGALGIPYLYKDYDQAAQLYGSPDGEIFKMFKSWVEEHDVHLLASATGAFRGFANVKKPVVTPDDLEGLKVRVYQDPVVPIFWGDKSTPTQLAFSEVHSALETGTVDAIEFQATSILLRHFDEVLNYYTDINWQLTPGGNFIVSNKAWNELPDDLKEKVEEAAWEAANYFLEVQLADEEKALEELEKRGMEVYRLSDEERQVWIDYARSLDDQIREAIGAEVFDQVMQAAGH